MKDKSSFEEVKKFLKENKELIRGKFGVKNISLFGSLVRGEDVKGSDLDILVEFEEGAETFKNYMGLKFFLEDALKRRVDIVITSTIKLVIKEDILGEAVYV